MKQYSFKFLLFLISLIVISSCKKNDENPLFIADFTSNTTQITEGETVIFEDSSSLTPTLLTWFFEGGNPSQSTIDRPAVLYDSSGNFDVTLIAGRGNELDTILKEDFIIVDFIPVKVEILVDRTDIIEGEEVVLSINQSGTPDIIEWTFEGGQPSKSSNNTVTVAYDTPGIYDVTLIGFDNFSRDSVTNEDYINVDFIPVKVEILVGRTDIVQGEEVIFSINQSGTPDIVEWTFEGGQPSNSSNSTVTVSYGAPGTFDVTLIGFDSFSSDSITNEDYINVEPLPISYPKQGLYGDNLLDPDKTSYSFNSEGHSLAADLPIGKSLKVVLTLISGEVWAYQPSTLKNWSITIWNGTDQTFTSIDDGTICDLRVFILTGSEFRIDVYEDGSETEMHSKSLSF